MNTNTCSHWACNKEDNTCVGCGAIICPIWLKVPVNCKCENKDNCCTSWITTSLSLFTTQNNNVNIKYNQTEVNHNRHPLNVQLGTRT